MRAYDASDSSSYSMGNFINAFFQRFTGPAEADVAAGQRLQFQRDVLDDMSLPRSAAEPFEEYAPLADATAMLDHRRQPRHQPFVEAGELVGGRILRAAPRSSHASSTGKLAQ